MVTHEFKINYYVLRKTGLYLIYYHFQFYINLLKYCGNPLRITKQI